MLESQTHRKLIFGAVEVGFVLTRVVVGYWLVLETGVLEWLLVGPKETSHAPQESAIRNTRHTGCSR